MKPHFYPRIYWQLLDTARRRVSCGFDDVVLFEKCSLTTSVGAGLSEQSLWDQEGRHQQPLPDQVQTRNLREIRLEGVASAKAGTNQ